MKSFTALATLLSVAAAAPACPSPAPPAEDTSAKAGLALRSASPIHFGQINAADLGIWINKNTSTYCPQIDSFQCASNPGTYYAGPFSTGGFGLSTTVPGGQIVYVASDNRVKFTQAHSGNTGTGSKTTGFAQSGDDLTFNGAGFVACPEGAANGAYAVYAGKGPGDNCLGFTWRLVPGQNATGVWQYS